VIVGFKGCAREVGRSMITLGSMKNKIDIVMDAGIKLGESIEYPTLSKEQLIKMHARDIIITHAHLDHAGYLPHIISNRLNIHATKPTRDLMQLLLSDYQRLQKNKSFSSKEVTLVLSRLKQHEYNDRFVVKGYNISLHDAGHIIGSSMIRAKKGNRTLLYTGDINDRESRLLSGCEMGLSAQTLIIEGTYSGKKDMLSSMKKASKQLVEIINSVLSRNGKVLIPSFAIGRGQEILMLLNDFISSGAIPKVPIYVDGMIKKALKIYRYNVIYAKRELQLRILMSDEDPFKSPYFKVSRKKNKSDVLKSGPCIIVTTSGMLTGGPGIIYFKSLASDPKNALIFIGYQAQGTLGRKLVDGEKEVWLRENGKEESIKVNMPIYNIHLSAHADHQGLIRFIKKIKHLKTIFLVHGEEKKLLEFAEYLNTHKYDVRVPKLGEEFKI